jgi:class II lanthipeptide synthase
MSAYRPAIASALASLRIETTTSFFWFGEHTPPLPAEIVAAMDADTARAYLRERVAERLYASFYCAGRAMPSRPPRTATQPPGPSPFVDSLSGANSGTGSRESGWTIVRTEADGRLVVHRHGLDLWARPGEVHGSDRNPGAEVSVLLPPELLRLSPGFYMALGDEELSVEEPIVRHYWHLRSSGAAALVAAVTGAFNEERIPFRFKVLVDPEGYLRCDAGVLYTPRRLLGDVAALLPSLRAEVAAHLRPGAPSLTKPLGEGLAVAEDPAGPDSFGMHRCRLIAEAAVRAFELGLEGSAEQLGEVERCFAEQGLAVDRPYLNGDSADEYEAVP